MKRENNEYFKRKMGKCLSDMWFERVIYYGIFEKIFYILNLEERVFFFNFWVSLNIKISSLFVGDIFSNFFLNFFY